MLTWPPAEAVATILPSASTATLALSTVRKPGSNWLAGVVTSPLIPKDGSTAPFVS
jgi:hypothetical protein